MRLCNSTKGNENAAEVLASDTETAVCPNSQLVRVLRTPTASSALDSPLPVYQTPG